MGIKAALCKIWEILGRNPRRNNLSKFTTFNPVFQLPHSALTIGPFKFTPAENENCPESAKNWNNHRNLIQDCHDWLPLIPDHCPESFTFSPTHGSAQHSCMGTIQQTIWKTILKTQQSVHVLHQK